MGQAQMVPAAGAAALMQLLLADSCSKALATNSLVALQLQPPLHDTCGDACLKHIHHNVQYHVHQNTQSIKSEPTLRLIIVHAILPSQGLD